jgi:hypothetical protein
MRHSRLEIKCHYRLGMTGQVRHAVNKANNRLYGKRAALRFRDRSPQKNQEEKIAICKQLRMKEKLARASGRLCNLLGEFVANLP